MMLRSAEQPHRDLEEAYRQHFLELDIRLSSIAIIVWLSASWTFLYTDYLLFGITEQFWLLALIRTLYVVCGAVLVAALAWVKRAVTFDWLLFSFMLVTGLFHLYITNTRPPTYSGYALTSVMAVLSSYLIFQTRLIFRLIPNLAFTVGLIILNYFRAVVDFVAWTEALILALILGNTLGIVVAVRFSQGRRAEFRGAWELKLSQAELKREIVRREQTEESLRLAKESAESAARAKEEFLANMSHEIRTPLNGIMGVIDLFLNTGLTKEQLERARVLKSSADTLLELLKDVLDLSKIEFKHLVLNETGFDVRLLLMETESMLTGRAGEKNLRLTCFIEPDVPRKLIGDPGRLRQILLNLGNNAVKFTHEGEIAFHVKLAERSNNRVRLQFSVTDTGIGISPDKIKMIFDRFTQADSSITKKYGGTGLGLAISSGLVRAMGGDIWVDSEPEKGSTFHFTVSLKEEDTDSAQSVKPLPCHLSISKPDLTGLKVLLADDNPVNQMVAEELLKREGCEVFTAANGRLAVEAFESRPFDVILMDLQMPEMDGLEATRTIRAQETSGRMPIIALTAFAFSEDRQRCLNAGMDDYLSKPISTPQLLRVLARYAPSANQKAPAAKPEVKTPVPEKETSRSEISDQERNRDLVSDHGTVAESSKAFNLGALRYRLDNDEEVLKEVVELFLTQLPDMLSDIRSAASDKNWELLKRHSHTLKGVASTVGAEALAEAVRELEFAAEDTNEGALPLLLHRLDEEVAEFQNAVQQFGLS